MITRKEFDAIESRVMLYAEDIPTAQAVHDLCDELDYNEGGLTKKEFKEDLRLNRFCRSGLRKLYAPRFCGASGYVFDYDPELNSEELEKIKSWVKNE